MKNRNAYGDPTGRRTVLGAWSTALALALTVSVSPAHAGHVTPPTVPETIKVPAGNTPFLLGHGVGTQNYICLPCPNPTTAAAQCPDDSGFAWLLFTPEATLFKNDPDDPKQLITHFFSPNPDEFNTDPFTDFHPIRATWQDSNDTSTVWARTVVPGDSVTVTPGAIAWLKLTVVGVQFGPTGGGALTQTTFVQRVNTVGGAAPPADTCDSLQEVGKQAFRPYTADYIFYTKQ